MRMKNENNDIWILCNMSKQLFFRYFVSRPTGSENEKQVLILPHFYCKNSRNEWIVFIHLKFTQTNRNHVADTIQRNTVEIEKYPFLWM